MRGPLTIDEQIAGMAMVWPRFSLLARDRDSAIWEGEVRPLFQTFAIRVSYRAPLVVELLDLKRLQPWVRVVDPPLRPRRNDPEGQLPHVYYTGEGALDVVLCMFDPEANEWSPTMSLAETTIPWAVDWLASYEGWRATGEWTGGGRHLESPVLDGDPR
ncbi:hypothetical protein [Roseomonas sp. BN140053]|uniref:hypothetical protein n=1 Tax=Roseomonas sp. BN140053 TaxID=3391898 RepID=UPI0039EA5B41